MTIRIRDFNPKDQRDGRALDSIIHDNSQGNVRLSDDYIMVAESTPARDGNDPIFSGVIVARPVLYVHEFVIAAYNLANRRHIGELMITHALSKCSVLGERYAHFSVAPDNSPMHEFISQYEPVREKDGVIYRLNIPVSHYPPRGGR